MFDDGLQVGQPLFDVANLQGPEERGAEVAHGVGDPRVHRAPADLVDRLAEQGHHVGGGGQGRIGRVRRQHLRLAHPAAGLPGGLPFLGPRRVMREAVVRPREVKTPDSIETVLWVPLLCHRGCWDSFSRRRDPLG